jgi:hypothetical protein
MSGGPWGPSGPSWGPRGAPGHPGSKGAPWRGAWLWPALPSGLVDLVVGPFEAPLEALGRLLEEHLGALEKPRRELKAGIRREFVITWKVFGLPLGRAQGCASIMVKD